MNLAVEKLAKSYGDKLIFKDVFFEAGWGEIVLVLGSNGSGKSTLLKILGGVEQPSFGSLRIDNSSATIGYMAHETFLYPQMSALENIEFLCNLYGRKIGKQDVHYKFKQFGLGAFLHEHVRDFSRGMAQKLSFIRVLCINPDIVLLDEPATGLDREAREIQGQEVFNLRQNGTLVFWVTHFPEFGPFEADKVLEIKNKTAYFATAD